MRASLGFPKNAKACTLASELLNISSCVFRDHSREILLTLDACLFARSPGELQPSGKYKKA